MTRSYMLHSSRRLLSIVTVIIGFVTLPKWSTDSIRPEVAGQPDLQNSRHISAMENFMSKVDISLIYLQARLADFARVPV